MSTRRVFVGIKICEKLQEEILRWEEPWQQKLPVRWLASQNLHITLIPPWYEESLEPIKKTLRTIVGKVHPCQIRFEQISFGPDLKHPRLIWAAGQTPLEILKLKKLLEEILNQTSGKREFDLHLTLARFQPKNFASLPIKSLNEKVDWQQTVDSVSLFEAHLFPTGAEYETILEIRF